MKRSRYEFRPRVVPNLFPQDKLDQLWEAAENDDVALNFLNEQFRDTIERPNVGKIDSELFDEATERLITRPIHESDIQSLYRIEGTRLSSVVFLLNPEAYHSDSRNEFGWIVIITDAQGKPVARARRTVKKNEYHDLVLEKNNLHLRDDLQNAGIGTAIHEQEEEWCRKNGIQYCTLETENVGGYVWAMMGYNFQDTSDRENIQQDLIRYCRKHQLTLYRDLQVANIDPQEQKQLLEEQREKWNQLGRHGTSWEMASLVAYDRTGTSVRVGKEVMVGSYWSGIRDLDPNSRSTRQHRLYMRYLRERNSGEAIGAAPKQHVG